MLIFYFICLNIFFAFLGYLLGRFGHVWLNKWLNYPKWAPHHWIYGIILIIIGLFFITKYRFFCISFGLGLLISDLKDFLNFKILEPDPPGKKVFWHID